MTRRATPADKTRLVEMATRFILSTRYQEYINIEPDRIAAAVDMMLEHGVIIVAELEHRVVGMIAVVGPFPHLLDGRLYAEEAGWWVEPEHRGGTVGPRLMHHMEGWCVQNRVYMVKMLAPADSDVGRFYDKCGYRAVETAWVKVFS